jgi:glycerol-3-phosphate dehydrogenase
VAVLERENDLCLGISRANSAIIYSGVDTRSGTLKTELTVQGNRDFDRLCEDLGVEFKRPGSLMVSFGPRGDEVLRFKYGQGQRNGVPGLRLLSGKEAREREPELAAGVTLALHAPTTGTVNPWQLGLAAARDALANGVKFLLRHEVVGIAGDGHGDYRLVCGNSVELAVRVVINCAGLVADRINDMVAPPSFRIIPTRGDYLVLDEAAGGFLSHIVFHEPEVKGKGATFVPTIDGNLMVGPSEESVEAGVGLAVFPTTAEGWEFNHRIGYEVFPGLPLDQVIRSFSTMRPNIYWASMDASGKIDISDESINTFHIAIASGHPRFINVAGIKTPGLTCADGIGRQLRDRVVACLGA